MGLFGYVRKHKPALWRIIHPEAPKPPKPAPIRRTARIRPVSKRRQATSAEYRREAGAAVAAALKAGLKCPVVSAIPELRNGMRYGHPISDKINEVHHRFGRIGQLLLWKPGWLLVSKAGHRWIHQHPIEARERGWLAPVGMFNNFKWASEFIAELGEQWKNNLISD